MGDGGYVKCMTNQLYPSWMCLTMVDLPLMCGHSRGKNGDQPSNLVVSHLWTNLILLVILGTVNHTSLRGSKILSPSQLQEVFDGKIIHTTYQQFSRFLENP